VYLVLVAAISSKHLSFCAVKRREDSEDDAGERRDEIQVGTAFALKIHVLDLIIVKTEFVMS
jgi:hypothetical protein